jgi:hypothetical protein
MKISIITADQVIIRDGVPAECQRYGAAFQVPAGEWAIHYNGETGVGEVEYIDARANEVIGKAEFDARYAYLLEHHSKAKANEQAEADALAAETAGVTA